MYRYIALLWNEQSVECCNVAERIRQRIVATAGYWRCAHCMDGLLVFDVNGHFLSEHVHPLKQKSGLIIGTVFDRHHGSGKHIVKAELNEDVTEKIVRSGGQYLVEHYWGSYVAFVRDPKACTIFVLRAPAGRLPCLYATTRGVDLFFSRTEDCVQLGLLHFSTNWGHVFRHLQYCGLLKSDSTGLQEMSQLAPGHITRRTASGWVAAPCWDPLKVASEHPLEDETQAVAEVREVVQSCVAAWAACHSNILLFLSGGLDSSIVLSCLTRAASEPNVICVNYVGHGTESDERYFARLAARAAGIELIEQIQDPSRVRLETVMEVERTALPLVYTYHLLNGDLESRLAKQNAASAVFTGFLGDSIFFSSASRYAATDYVKRHGLRGRLFSVALECARRERLLFWSVLLQAVKQRLGGPCTPNAGFSHKSILLSKEVTASADPDVLATFFSTAERQVAAGKLSHLIATSLPYTYHDPFGNADRPETIPPLVSQPLLELCYRIPTYVLSVGGKDRGLARVAFESQVIPQIIRRRTKGAGTLGGTALFAANHGFLRELLLDGVLMRNGFLDRAAVERTLATPHSISNAVAADLPICYSTEVWLRRWRDIRQHRVVG